MMRKYLFLLSLFFIFSESYSQGFLSLKLGADSRSAALGQTGTVLNEYGSTGYWNPAGLAFIEGKHLQISHHRWIQSVTSNYLGCDLGGENTSWGFHVLFTEVGGIEQRSVPSAEPESVFSFYELVFGISYAKKLQQDLSFGITLKGLTEKIYIERAFGVACDLGLQYAIIQQTLRLGAVFQNLGTSGKLDKERIELPACFRLGLGYSDDIMGTRFNLLLDGIIEKKNVHVHGGLELIMNDIFFIRGGYQTGYEVKGITAGLGILWNSIGIDYAYMPIKRGLGDSHRITCRFIL